MEPALPTRISFDLDNVVAKKAKIRQFHVNMTAPLTAYIQREASKHLPCMLVLARETNLKYQCFTYEAFNKTNNWGFKSYFYYTATVFDGGEAKNATLKIQYCGKFKKIAPPYEGVSYDDNPYLNRYLMKSLFDAMKEGTAESKYWLGLAYRATGDTLHANKWLQLAAEENHPMANFELFKNAPGDISALKKAADGGVRNARYGYSKYLYTKGYKIAAFNYCLKAAKRGHVDAQVYMWKVYQKGAFGQGRRILKDSEKAHMWMTLAALNGHPFAQEQLNRSSRKLKAASYFAIYRGCLNNSFFVNNRTTHQLLEMAATNGRIQAYFPYACRLSQINMAKAVSYYERAAHFGHQRAKLFCNVLKGAYTEDSQEITLARRFGQAFLNDKSLPENKEKGRDFLSSAAFRGDKQAQISLGHFFLDEGQITNAAAWFKIASLQNDSKRGREQLKNLFLSNKYSSESLEEAKKVCLRVEETFKTFGNHFNKQQFLVGKSIFTTSVAK